MRIGPYDGKIKLDDQWFGGRQGYNDQFDNYIWTNEWKWTRHFLPQCWYSFSGSRRKGKRGAFVGTLKVHFGHYRDIELGKVKAAGPLVALNQADALIEKHWNSPMEILRWLGDGVYPPELSVHVWIRRGDEWVPFCSHFPKAGEFSSKFKQQGDYMEVHASGAITRTCIEGWGCTSHGFRDRTPPPNLHRWNWYYTPQPISAV